MRSPLLPKFLFLTSCGSVRQVTWMQSALSNQHSAKPLLQQRMLRSQSERRKWEAKVQEIQFIIPNLFFASIAVSLPEFPKLALKPLLDAHGKERRQDSQNPELGRAANFFFLFPAEELHGNQPSTHGR